MLIDIKYIAPYLPYDLNLEEKYFSKKHNEEIVNYLILDKDNFTYFYPNNQIKPILRPLSDLTKKELRDAGFDYQIDWLTNELEDNIKRYGSLENVIKKTDFGHVQYLLSKHYDIFGIIEQGLAIDINDLPNI